MDAVELIALASSVSLLAGWRLYLVTFVTGLAMSLRKPEPRPSRSNIVYNQLLRELLSKRNADIAQENALRRSQITLTVQPAP